MSEVDAALRQVSRRFPDALAKALSGEHAVVRSAAWIETQLTERQRRLDRALRAEVDGEVVVHHVEWAWSWTRALPYRVFEYHAMLAMALHADDEEHAPPIESTVVLLSGRERRWQAFGRYRTSPRGGRFAGVRFRIDAVYQQSVAELRARGSELWLAFAPLARDADVESVAGVAREISERVPDAARRADLAAAMIVLAEADARGRGLNSAVAPFFSEELIMQSSIYTTALQRGFEKGRAAGEAEGRRVGEAEGRRVGEAEGRRVGEVIGRAEGRAEGRADGLREAILVLCDVLDVALDDERRRWVASAAVDALEERLAHLRARRAWPA